MPQNNPKVTNIALNGSAGAEIVIATTIPCRKVEIQEDAALNGGTPQGLQGHYLDPQSSTTAAPVIAPNAPNNQVFLPCTAGQQGRAYQPIIFGGSDAGLDGGMGNYVGAQGTCLISLKSNSATATGITLVEWP